MAFPPREAFPRQNLYRAWVVVAVVIFIVGLVKWIAHSGDGPGYVGAAVVIFFVVVDRINRRLNPRGGRRIGYKREPIPQRVRNEIWNRDGGRCVDCGSRERLEYDHIIPLSKGGSNTPRNLELRCETCNRRKGARI